MRMKKREKRKTNRKRERENQLLELLFGTFQGMWNTWKFLIYVIYDVVLYKFLLLYCFINGVQDFTWIINECPGSNFLLILLKLLSLRGCTHSCTYIVSVVPVSVTCMSTFVASTPMYWAAKWRHQSLCTQISLHSNEHFLIVPFLPLWQSYS